jgi:endoglucanase
MPIFIPMKRIVSLALLLCALTYIPAQSLAHVREARFGMGANITNWLEAYWMVPNWPQPGKYQKADLQAMKDAGMATVRLPFCFYLITDQQPPYAVDFGSPGIAWLDSVIAWTADLQLNLIIVNQHGWEVTNANYADKIPPMTAMWRQVVQHYASLDPEHYFFEVLNEPPVGLLPQYADAVNTACIDTIRHHDTQHTLVCGPHTASIGSSYLTFSPYADTNLIYTFHTYEPLYFTHQGFPWSTPNFPTGTPFPLLGDDALVTSSIDAAVNWRDTYQLPVFMGEFGVGKFADATSRCNWIALLGQLISDNGLHALYWDWGGVAPSDFSMFDTLPATAANMIPCFREALHLYASTAEQPMEIAIDRIQISPNPAGEALTIYLPQGLALQRIEWMDLSGKMLAFQNIAVAESVHLDLQDLPRGMLLLKLWTRRGACRVLRVEHL